MRRIITSIVFACVLLLAAAGCRHAKVTNPIANIDSKQPDKTLFDRAMKEMKGAKFVVARTLLETLINTYPDSEYVARAKLSIGDSWMAEGGTAAMQQAEAEYKDFITFFPNLPEAAEAQLKIADIHYKQMEKPDRDYAHVVRAEDEYKTLIQTYPNSSLLPQAKQKLREVQEVLAQRQFGVARFYYLRDNMAAAQARFKSLADSYPLYSGVDEALYMLGSIYEREAKAVTTQKLPEAVKEKLRAEFEKGAIDAYSRIITRYPAMGRMEDAKKRLADMKAPIPTPTPEAIAQSKQEEDSRGETTRFNALVGTFKRHPDVAKAAQAGEPSMEPVKDTSAVDIVRTLTNATTPTPAATAKPAATGSRTLGIDSAKAGTGTPDANQPPPSSDTQTPGAPQRVNELQPNDQQTTDQQTAANGKESTSKKKKKGLRKIIPF